MKEIISLVIYNNSVLKREACDRLADLIEKAVSERREFGNQLNHEVADGFISEIARLKEQNARQSEKVEALRYALEQTWDEISSK